MPMFRSSVTDNLDTVTAKLAEARAAVGPIEAELAAAALDHALDPAAHPIEPVQQRLRSANERVRVLELAVAEAQRREDKRLAEARSDAEKAR